VAAKRLGTAGLVSFTGILGIAVPMHLGVTPEAAFMLIGPLGSSAALIAAAPDAPLAQPRNVVGGHMVGGADMLGSLHALHVLHVLRECA
jgi:CBS-domain-containing membrane protein